MKKLAKILISILCAALLALPVLCAACKPESEEPEPDDFVPVDYVSELKLNMNTNSKKLEVTVRTFVDGDTTHFDPVTPTTDFATSYGYVKARYLAINTPESTGRIEEWGKAASKFTRSKLETAESIIIESDDGNWNHDSTGTRYLLWVWYKPKGATDYRNLNVEILQNGYAQNSTTSNLRYSLVANNALEQAKKMKLHLYSGEKDPDFFYGNAIPMTMKELRCHIEDYNGQKVMVEGVIICHNANSVYVEDYDEDEDIYFGISVYYGTGASGDLLGMFAIGNRVKIVGTVSYYETGDIYQIADVSYKVYKPDDPSNCQLVSTGNTVSFTELDVNRLAEELTFEFDKEDEDGTAKTEEVTIEYGDAIMSTSATLSGLKVKSVYTTDSDTSSDGALSITCEVGGKQIVVRTAVLHDSDGKLVTAEAFEGKTISVKGLVAKYKGKYQLFCYSYSNITFIN